MMTKRERVACNAGVEAVRQMAMVAAISIEVRDDASEVRMPAAAAHQEMDEEPVSIRLLRR